MDASYTVKKSQIQDPDLTPENLAEVIKITATYIARWTQRELKHITANSRLPICWPLPGGGYMIGRDRIVPEAGYWRRLDAGLAARQLFTERQSAIFYCLCRHVGENTTADEIVKYDGAVRSLRNDLTHYATSLERNIIRQDCFKIGVWSARYDDARIYLAEAERQLKKSIAKAKYSTAIIGTGK